MNRISDDTEVLKVFYRKRVITVDTLSSLLDSSIKTARRRLKLWEAYTSYNENGRYYTLPDMPEFDANGLWSCRSVRFSKHGDLRQTAIQLIRLSKAGIDAAEMAEILAVPVRLFLSAMQERPGPGRAGRSSCFACDSLIKQDFGYICVLGSKVLTQGFRLTVQAGAGGDAVLQNTVNVEIERFEIR